MLFSSMFTKSTSNCLDASRSAFSGDAPACVRSRSRPRGSSTSEAAPVVMSDDLQFGAQRACGFHGLQYRQQVRGGGTDRVQRFHYVVQVRAANHREHPFVLADLYLGTLADDRIAAARKRRRLT